jgi:glycerophosphoryl diester phosphodiesterase
MMKLHWIRVGLVAIALIAGSATLLSAQAQAPELIAALKDGSGKRVLVTAHRAAHDIHPENSMAAIERAISLGVDIIEIDTRLTKDGVPVLMHDASVDRTTTGKGAVRELTFAQIHALRLKGADGKPTDQVVPTLYEALKAMKGRALVDLDLKTGDLEPIISRVIETDMLEQSLFFNGNYPFLDKFRAIAPVLAFPRAHSTEEAAKAAAQFKPEAIHIDDGFNTDATHKAAMATDSRLWINALGDPDKLVAQGKAKEGIDPLLAHGASIIQTDHPAALIAYLKSIGRR